MNILKNYRQLLMQEPTIRAVDAAKQLQITEAQLIAAQVGDGVTQLNITHLEGILKGFKKLQHVMALTRSAHIVSEISGCYEKIYCSERNGIKTAIAINPGGIDLRLFISKWHSAFAVQTNPKYSSIQFFDQHGTAVHKVFTTEQTDMAAFEQLVTRYKSAKQSTELAILAPEITVNEYKPLPEIDIQGFREGWKNLQDVHQFPALLTKFAVSRTQGLEIAGKQWAQEVSPDCLTEVFETVRDQQSELMIFVNNHGAVQIYSGKLQHLKQVGKWYNVLDNGFNLHLLTDQFSRAFVVKKPTDSGATEVHSIEFFDSHGNTTMTLFGRRTEGKVQSRQWVALCNRLREQEIAAYA
ncbi:hemin-degrading factor [Pseudoalteromonas sp. S1727]|uniref:hemin-degrading factor n=1 Tax=Pseudoalteromonas sp. S1727 TaxID=2066514 RepID=UPI001108A090|nr:ChuX/HutX family heme-like substrate-binding protein [Pseudoalteromonas sp. S1727]TMN71941.1 hemin-degrading factor [Pseudoalteromonas sp. S1727]